MASNDCAVSADEESENVEQQKMELEMLQSIFTKKELTVLKEDSEYLVTIIPKLNSDVQLSLSNPQSGDDQASSGTRRLVKVTHLPEVTLYIKYSPDYPSINPPTFHISSCWLDPKLPKEVNERLLECFTPGFPVVYEWTLFIQDELVDVYGHHQQWQQPEKGEEEQSPQKEQKGATKEEVDGNGVKVETSKVDIGRIFLRSSSLLNDVEEFDSYEKHKEFQQAEHECGICCLTYVGSALCRPCEGCGLIYCKSCLKGYCQMCIDEGKITHLICPEQGCSANLSDIFLKSALAEDLFERYIKLKDEANLDAVPGVVFCPRRECAARNFSDLNSNVVQCDNCGFPFCKLCNQTWHGPGICPSVEKLKAMELVADNPPVTKSETKTRSEAAERKKIEELKSVIWIRSADNVKLCPKCQTGIQKNGGCNHMVCRRCNTHFCWLCGRKILGYEHFSSDNCDLFRTEDYLPPQDKTKDVAVPDDIQLLENALVSECPRCRQSETKCNKINWIHCRHCQFQYCHLCREPCYGLWHFDEVYGCKRSTTVKEDLAIATSTVS